MNTMVYGADVQDDDGDVRLHGTFFSLYAFVRKIFTDAGYQGPVFENGVADIITQAQVEVVRRSYRVKGSVLLPRRWIVERTLAWLNRCARLAKEWGNKTRNALEFLQFASTRLMLKISAPQGARIQNMFHNCDISDINTQYITQ